MVKSNLFLMLCFLLLFANSLWGQKNDGLSFEISTTVGYTNFALAPHLTVGSLNSFRIESKTKGGLLYGLGVGIGNSFNDRIHWSTQLQVLHGNFRHRLEGLVFATDIINSFDDPETSTLESQFQYWNLELPIQINFNFSTAPNAYHLIAGAGVAMNLSSNGDSKMIRSDGTEEQLEKPVYQSEALNGFALIGLGKKIPLSSSGNNLLLRIIGKYYFLQEGLSTFHAKGHLFNTNLEVAYQF